jgi:presenilin-like A22 family membrane protease
MLDLAEGVMDLRIPVVLVIPTTLSYSLLDTDFSGANEVHEDGADEKTDRDDDGTAGAGAGMTADGGSHGPDGDGKVGTETDAGVEAESTERSGETNGVGGARGGEAEPGADGDDDTDADTDGSTRDAFFIGLGDAVMPTVMVASGAFFSPAASLGVASLPALNLPALVAMGGTFLGFFVLMWAVTRGRAHAGLPLLNGGAVGGYLVGSLLAGVPLVEALGLAPYL